MDDLTITRLCADAMGMRLADFNDHQGRPYQAIVNQEGFQMYYSPLHDDAQAMGLVKKFGLHPVPEWDEGRAWTVFGGGCNAMSDNLNRAICECVAKMQAERSTDVSKFCDAGK
jgi:hypothetical protein